MYKGYFVPVEATECPPLPTVTVAPTMAPPPASSAAQSWGDAPARIANKPKPSRKGQQNTDVEVFDSDSTSTTPDPLNKPNINIEIHNVFSFGTGNNATFPPRNGETDSKISGSKTDQNHSNPPIIYA